MSLYRLAAEHVSRNAGQSLIQKWAYDSRSKIRDQRTGTTYNHSKEKFDLLASGSVGLPGSCLDVIEAIDRAEKLPKAVTGMDIITAGQWELHRKGDPDHPRNKEENWDRNASVADAFCKEVYRRWGLPCAWAYHRAPKKKLL